MIFGLAGAALGILFGCFKKLPVCLACLGVALGLCWFHGYTQVVRTPAETLAEQTLSFTAIVTDYPKETSTGNICIEVRLHLADAPDPKVLLYSKPTDQIILPGDTIRSTARFRLADKIQGEDSSYYEAKGIYLRGNITKPIRVSHPDRIPVSAWGTYIAHTLQNSASSIFPDDVSGLMSALLTGDKSGLSDSTYTSLQRSGAAHIVAVSGLHLSFFASLLAFFFRRHSKSGAVLTILLIFLFAAVANFTPSVMRAAFMVTMTILAPLFRREEDKPTTLTFALFVLLLINPYAAQSISLQLSFAAVAGIHLVSSPLYETMTRALPTGSSLPRRIGIRVVRFLAANLSLTAGAILFTTPLTAIHFGTVSLISPLTNLLSLWAVSIVFSVGLVLALLAMMFPAFAAILAYPITLLARYVLEITRYLAAFPFASLSTQSAYLSVWLCLVYFILLIVFLLRCRRPIIPCCIAVITLCIALLLNHFSLFSSPLSITMLDVGQGQCILVTSGRYTALIDCGGSKDNAGDIAADYLQSAGISHLDLLVLTHCHDDHANGVTELFSRLEVSSVIFPYIPQDSSPYRAEIMSLARTEGSEITILDENIAVSFGDAVFTMYAPLGDGGGNEEGLFVLVSYDDFDLLVTGDANSFVETLLLKYNQLPDIEVLAIGHHGSKNSTCAQLLDELKPETCLISVGYNTYGHPAPETLKRLTDRNITIQRTDQMGHLTIQCKGE